MVTLKIVLKKEIKLNNSQQRAPRSEKKLIDNSKQKNGKNILFKTVKCLVG